jgi:glycerol uptake facilitator-like aquaporin
MGYSLAAKFCSEAVGMCLTIFLGEGIIANELLPSTKGQAMGFLAVAIGFAFAFGVNIAWFSAISAHLVSTVS